MPHVCLAEGIASRSSTTSPTARARACRRAQLIHVGDVTKPGELEPVIRRRLRRRLPYCRSGVDHPRIRQPGRRPAHQRRGHPERPRDVPAGTGCRGCIYASSMTALRRHAAWCRRRRASRAGPNSYYGITKFAAERYVHATAARPDLGFAFQRHLAAHVQRLRARARPGTIPTRACSASSSATCCAASRSRSSATASRRATSSTSTTSSTAGCAR